ncbi:CCA tRNA nucleotidyltransferase [Paenibacillus tuaregi]|uniref:CCA tRNA nucleotidyltransferase n=1 Tax=Paenibacillus tuaregi TaxID=1816681 RepID=UPI0008388F43|nr:CCA tRNA nucleotidyltransferase [Paenibacillus tuaregi]
MKMWTQVEPAMMSAGVQVLTKLTQAGYEAYWVGGCVRDEIMGRPVHDMDIATSAKPEDVIQLFDRSVPTGLKHGTVTVLIGKQAFEVTTFRKETEYEDHRRPVSVQFVDAIREDLERRDFTMNAMAMDLEGNLTDPFQGRRDIELKVIRCVGDADKRFDEDALRMIRAVRFASVFGFRLVPSTWRAIMRSRDKMGYIATERIRTELEKMLAGPDPIRGLELLRRSRLLEQAKIPADLTHLDEKRLKHLSSLPAEPLWLRLSLLIQALHIPEDEVLDLLKRWTFSNRDASAAAGLVRFDQEWSSIVYHSRHLDTAESIEFMRRSWIALQLAYGKEIAGLWIDRAVVLTQASKADRPDVPGSEQQTNPNMTGDLEQIRRWHTSVPLHQVKELALTGTDVLEAAGRPGGPWLSILMKKLLLAAAVGDVANEHVELIEEVKRMVNEDEA